LAYFDSKVLPPRCLQQAAELTTSRHGATPTLLV
jgi:hypothetical protein